MVFKTWICWTNCSLGFLISLFPVNQFVSTRKQSSRNCELKQSVSPYLPMCIRLATFTTLQIFPSAYKDCITARGFQTINLRTTITVSEWEKHECVQSRLSNMFLPRRSLNLSPAERVHTARTKSLTDNVTPLNIWREPLFSTVFSDNIRVRSCLSELTSAVTYLKLFEAWSPNQCFVSDKPTLWQQIPL